MKLTTIFAVVFIVIGSFTLWKPQAVTPTVSIEAPNFVLQEIVAPVTKVLSGHSTEAGELAAFYYEVSKVILRDEAHGKVIKTTGHLRMFCERAVTLRFQGIFTRIPGLAEVIHGPQGILAETLKLEAGKLDYAETVEVFSAIAWACQEAG